MGCLDPSHTCQNVRTKHRPTTPPMSRLSAEDVAHHAQDQPAKGSRHKGAGEAQPGGHRRAVEEVFSAEPRKTAAKAGIGGTLHGEARQVAGGGRSGGWRHGGGNYMSGREALTRLLENDQSSGVLPAFFVDVRRFHGALSELHVEAKRL